jgi:hypothetical protein
MRNKYTEAYKTSAVKMVLEEGKMPVEVAANFRNTSGGCINGFANTKGLIRKEKRMHRKKKLNGSKMKFKGLKSN